MLRGRLFWILLLPIVGAFALIALAGIAVENDRVRVPAVLIASIAAGAGAGVWIAMRAVRPIRRSLASLRGTSPLEPGGAARDEGAALEDASSALAGWREGRAAALATQRGRLDAFIDAQDDPAFLADAQGRIERCNDAANRAFGAAGSALTGRALRELFTRADVIDLHHAAQRGRRGSARVPLPTPSGERVYEIVVTPLERAESGGGATPTATILRDVTELAEPLRVKTDFVANASHELRTPLAAIRAGVETLAEGAKNDPRMVDRVLEMVAGHVARLEDLTRDLLDLSRFEQPGLALRVEPLIRSKLIAGLHAEFEPVMRRRSIRIEFDLEPALDGVLTDPRLLFVVLRNLLDNATKFCHERTAVQVRARRADDAADGRSFVRFEVRDQGIGIPIAQQQRIFERFYQVDPGRSGLGAQRRGTGLGLAIARHAVRAMGGQIGVESVWMQGATFWFEIPTPPAADPPEADQA